LLQRAQGHFDDIAIDVAIDDLACAARFNSDSGNRALARDVMVGFTSSV
jgi:hypothetical protein